MEDLALITREQTNSPKSLRLILHFGNGIGIGHQVRCVNLATSIRSLFPATRILFIGHTKNVRPIVDAGFSYVQAPVLWNLPESATRFANRQLLADIIRTFDPDIYVQDGESDYGGEGFFELAVPLSTYKVLLLVRYSEDTMRRIMNSQRFRATDLVVIAQTLDDFYPSLYSQSFLQEMAHNPKIFFSGPITRAATDQQISAVRAKYGLDGSKPIILFTAGAGGQHSHCDHAGSHDGEEFFAMASHACETIARSGLNVRTIVVTGPYGPIARRFANATVITYDPLLPAIIASSSLIVFRPGYNVLHEALLAKCPAIIVPSVATPENQLRVAENLALTGAARVVPMGDAEALFSEILRVIQNDTELSEMKAAADRICVPNGSHNAALHILTMGQTP